MKLHRSLVLLCTFLAVASVGIARAQTPASTPVVRAILFYSPDCPHCQYVIQQVLPPLFQQYGKRLQIIGFDVNHPQGQALFRAAIQRFGVEDAGVPFLVIDDIYLVGSNDIPEKLPALVETYLKLGGVDWPDVPGLREVLDSAAAAATAGPATPEPTAIAGPVAPEAAAPIPTLPGTESPALTWTDRFRKDLAGNTLAVFVLAALVASVVLVVWVLRKRVSFVLGSRLAWAIPWVCLAGAAVAAYLAYVELTQTVAVCGPVGDCNTVQSSVYARLFGVVPIGVLGILAYFAIGLAWVVGGVGNGSLQRGAAFALLALPILGTLFSIYLTFLEPFVIGATCAWCLLSAILMAILALLAVEPARRMLSAPAPPQGIRHRPLVRTRTRQAR